MFESLQYRCVEYCGEHRDSSHCFSLKREISLQIVVFCVLCGEDPHC